MSSTSDSEILIYSRQKFQNILLRLEILVSDIDDPATSRDTIKKFTDAILATSYDFAKTLQNKRNQNGIHDKLTV